MQAVIPTALPKAASAVLSLEACYAEHQAKVFHLGLRYGGGDAAWAEDLTHDVFLRFAEKQSELERLDDVGGWIYRVACNLAISRLRREKSFWGRASRLIRADADQSAPGADTVLEERELADRALSALNSLPAKERVVLSMKLLDDKTQTQIASTLSMSEGYVSKLVARALKRLQQQGWGTGS